MTDIPMSTTLTVTDHQITSSRIESYAVPSDDGTGWQLCRVPAAWEQWFPADYNWFTKTGVQAALTLLELLFTGRDTKGIDALARHLAVGPYDN